MWHFRQHNPRASARRAASRIDRLTTQVEELEYECRELKYENVEHREEIAMQKALRHQALEDHKKANNLRNQQFQTKENEIRRLTQELSRAQNQGQFRGLQGVEEAQKMRDEINRLQEENRKLNNQQTHSISNQNSQYQQINKETNALLQARSREIQELQRELARTTKKDDEIKRLQKELIKYKGAINASNYVEGQVSDDAICAKFSGLFYAMRDWAMDLSRQDQLNLQPASSADAEILYHQVPYFQDGTSKQKMHALIATFSHVLIKVMDRKFIFGYAASGPTRVANKLAKHLEGIPEATKQKKKQWVAITNGILSKDVQASQEVSEDTLANFIILLEQTLQETFGPSFQADIVSEFRAIIGPYMPIIFALHLQDADYVLTMLPAIVIKNGESKPQLFDAAKMEDLNGEDEGILQASFFPMLTKEIMNNDGEIQRVVICKAKVMVAP